MSLIGENINFGGSELLIDLIPSTSWGLSAREFFTYNAWKKARKICIERANGKCEICGSNLRLELHERWSYNDDIQKLERLIILCKKCHMIAHYGRTKMLGFDKEIDKHYTSITGKPETELHNLFKKAMDEWMERSKIIWTIDLSLMGKNNFSMKLKYRGNIQNYMYKLQVSKP